MDRSLITGGRPTKRKNHRCKTCCAPPPPFQDRVKLQAPVLKLTQNTIPLAWLKLVAPPFFVGLKLRLHAHIQSTNITTPRPCKKKLQGCIVLLPEQLVSTQSVWGEGDVLFLSVRTNGVRNRYVKLDLSLWLLP